MNRNKNTVAHVTNSYFRFSENWIHTQIKHLDDWQPLVLTHKTENLDLLDWLPNVFARKEELSILLEFSDKILNKGLGFYPSYYFRARKENIKLIHAHFGTVGYQGLALSSILNVPLVTTFYGLDASKVPVVNPKWRTRYQRLFAKGTLFLAEGNAMKRQLIELGCPSDKIKVQHLGIEVDQFPVRKEYVVRPELNILMAGRFVEKKGFIYGLKAFDKFLSKDNKGKLTIIGDSDGSEEGKKVKAELYKYVLENNLDEQVVFRGIVPLSLLKAAYYEHDVFLSPSVVASNGDNEGGAPVSILEAAATGMPVISTKHCDIPEIVIHGETGLLADERNYKSLANLLETIYTSRNFTKKIGISSAEWVKKNYDAKKQGIKLSKIYKELI